MADLSATAPYTDLITDPEFNKIQGDEGFNALRVQIEGNKLNTLDAEKTLGVMAGSLAGLYDLLGSPETRRGFERVHGEPFALAGTWTISDQSAIAIGQNGNVATGQELLDGEWVAYIDSGNNIDARKVLSVGGNQTFTVGRPFGTSANNVTLYRIPSVAERFARLERSGIRGLLLGGFRRDGNNPPSIAPGSYEVDGLYTAFTSDQTLTWIDNHLGNSAPINNCHYVVNLENDGTKTVHAAYGDPIVSGAQIESIADAGGGAWDLRVLNSTSLNNLYVGALAVSTGTDDDGNRGVFEVIAFSDTDNSGGSGMKFVRIANARGATQPAPNGELEVHYRVNRITDPADTEQETPYLNRDVVRNGFYSEFLLKLNRNARGLIIFYVNSSGVVEPSRISAAGNGLEWADAEGAPIGSVCEHAVPFAPAGWIECDGRAVSRALFDRLFDRIGTTFGAGDGATTFNVPDLRGEFVRGWDNGRGVDTGRAFGSSQADTMQGHRHAPLGGGNFATSTAGSFAFDTVSQGSFAATTGDPVSDGANGTPRTSSETRPRNVALLYCIKY